MALGKSIKMYLTIFIATTCVYMVLYQYHISREPIPSPEVIKNKINVADSLKSATNSRFTAASLVKRYNFFLWSPLSLMTSHASSSVASPSLSSSSSSSSTTSLAISTASLSTLKSPTASALTSSSLLSSRLAISSALSASSISSSSSSSSTSSTASTVPKELSSTSGHKSDTHNTFGPLGSISNELTNTTTTVTTTTTKSTNNNATTTTIKPTVTSTTLSQSPRTTPTSTTSSVQFAATPAPPPLYIITPTYRRSEQLAELTRLGYTLKHVTNLLWLVIEDANKTSALVTQTLNRIGVPFEYLVAPMPEEYKKTKKAKPRGVSNRNRGLHWLRHNATDGVFYFADDDNTYDISIFEQMRYTQKVSMWPVGLVTKFGVSSPIIRKGKIEGFYDGWIGGRKYPVDMAGFAVSVKFLHERPNAKMPFKPGYEEDGFLKSLAPLNNTEIELLAANCTEILTWHTQTKKNGAAQALNMTKYSDTNLVSIDKNLIRT